MKLSFQFPWVRILPVLFLLCAAVSAEARSPIRECAEKFEKGDLAGAEAALTRAKNGQSTDTITRLEEAALREEAGDLGAAATLYTQAASANGQEDLQVDAASCLARSGDWDHAVQMLRSFLQNPPGMPEALWELALTHRALARRSGQKGSEVEAEWRAARNRLADLAALQPDMGAAQYLIGECSEALGDETMALAAYQSALALEPSYKKLDARVARLYKRLGRSSDALIWYERATAVDPSNQALQEEKSILLKRHSNIALLRSEERQKKWEAVTPPLETALPDSPITIRVGLETHLSRLVFRGGGDLRVTTPAGNLIRTLEGNCDYKVSWSDKAGTGALSDDRGNTLVAFSQRLWIEPIHPTDTVVLHALASGTGYFFASEGDRAYRGLIEIHPGLEPGFTVIDRVSLECYVAGVLPSEMPSYWPLEALKAQAVAARTDVLAMMGRHNAEGFDVCDEVHCQAYRGIQAERVSTNRAVQETAGQVLWWKGQPFPAVYSAQCGGHTQSYEDAWGKDLPDVGVPDYDEENSPGEFPLPPWELKSWVREGSGAYCDMPGLKGYRNFRWVYLVTAADLESKERLGGLGRIKSVRVIGRSDAGWANEVLFTGENGERTIRGDAIRGVLGGLRSNLIWLEAWNGSDGFLDELVIYGGGWGHGVGMCQVGACALAKKGWDSRRILKHYYPKASFKNISRD